VNVVYNEETNVLMLEIEDTGVLANLSPDFQALLASHDSINGVLVTAPSYGDDYDFHSRYFWPWSGTNEDPVTGGTHTFLAPYWASRLGKNSLRSFQSSKRSGFMQLDIHEDKLLITSQAQIVLSGEMRI
jgi:predicted PhzF superfamily epimerase YddE/YHI9